MCHVLQCSVVIVKLTCLCLYLNVSERNLSNVEEIGTCSYINHIITMTTLYIQQVCHLYFFSLSKSNEILAVKKFSLYVCHYSSRAKPKRRRWQTRARRRSLFAMRWLSVRASTIHTTTGGIEPAGNNILTGTITTMT